VYLAGSALVAAGYADYPLLAYHFAQTSSIALPWIPAAYALAMGVDAIAALVFGRLFDRFGLGVLLVATAISAVFAPLALGSRADLAIAGTILWGIGMGAQESIMRAAIANMTSPAKRATAYGVFNLVYGVAWFCGSALMGWLYSRSLGWLITFSVIAQVLAVPFFGWSKRLSSQPS
jgi:MFS family permease